MDCVVGDVLLEMIQDRLLSLKRHYSLKAFRNHSDMEVITSSMQIGRFDNSIWNYFEHLLPHPLHGYHGIRKRWFEYGLVAHKVTDEEYAEWEAIVNTVYPYIRGKLVPEEAFDKVVQLRDNFRANRLSK